MKADPKGVLTGVHYLDGDFACGEGAMAAVIGLDEKASYELDAEASYGKISYHEGGGKVSRIQESNSMKVYGRVGSDENPTASVNVNTRYAGVKLDY